MPRRKYAVDVLKETQALHDSNVKYHTRPATSFSNI